MNSNNQDPTLQPGPRREVTTTDDPERGGQPRLFVGSSDPEAYEPEYTIHWLKDGVTTIGSGPGCDLQLEGIEEFHAEVVHDDTDELVVVAHFAGVLVNGAEINRQLLRTGSHVQIGAWSLVFAREEFADHGRPYGGRIGGEFGHQRKQPPRVIPTDPPHA